MALQQSVCRKACTVASGAPTWRLPSRPFCSMQLRASRHPTAARRHTPAHCLPSSSSNGSGLRDAPAAPVAATDALLQPEPLPLQRPPSLPPLQQLNPSAEPIATAAQAAVQQLQQQAASLSQQVVWDLDWFHYTPWWYKPPIVILAGVSFVVGCNLGTSPSLKTTIIAAAPVAVAWFIFLYMVPRQFADFAKQYIRTHPRECEEQARKCHEEHLQQQQHQQTQ